MKHESCWNNLRTGDIITNETGHRWKISSRYMPDGLDYMDRMDDKEAFHCTLVDKEISFKIYKRDWHYIIKVEKART